MYIKRTIEKMLFKAVEQFPAVMLTGPRQVGKTTTLKRLFPSYKYITMDDPESQLFAKQDPKQFLSVFSPPVIIDEVQLAPNLLSYVKLLIDENRSLKGQFILTGSQNLLLSEKISESLAGRVAVLKMMPLTTREINDNKDKPLIWQEDQNKDICKEPIDYWNDFIRGNFPELISDSKIDSKLWLSSYMQTYLERDVRTIKQIEDLNTFQSFLILLAARSGQMLNIRDISKELGVSLNTCKSWLSVLEASYQIIILRPYFQNVGKRLVKTPKIYFTDTGLLCHLLKISSAEQAIFGPFAGGIFETAVISEIYKTKLAQGEEPHIYFWRTSNGAEVDVVIQEGLSLIAVEAKSSATINAGMARGLKIFMNDYNSASKGYVISLSKTQYNLTDNIRFINFMQL